MTRCLLLRLHGAGYQGVLDHLSAHDYASLRQVSRAISKHTTLHLPYITLKLSKSSSKAQLQQWLWATQQLHHVTRVDIHILGKVTAEVFEAAMQLLSQRRNVKELQISPFTDSNSGSSSDEPYLPTLRPIAHILSQLTELVIQGISTRHIVRDLQQLTSIAASTESPSQLQVLELQQAEDEACTHWSEFACTLKQLVTAFVYLKRLAIQLPKMDYQLEAAEDEEPSTADPALASDIDSDSADEDHFAVDDEVDAVDEDSDIVDADDGVPEEAQGILMQQVQVATVAAIVNAVISLPRLEGLHISGLPDIWKHAAAGTLAAVAAVAATQTPEVPVQNAVIERILCDQVLSSTAAAATVFSKLEHLGYWLLQHRPKLMYVGINTSANTWAMSWLRSEQSVHKQQQPLPQQLCVTSDSSCPTRECDAPTAAWVAGLHASEVEWNIFGCWRVLEQSSFSPAPAAGNCSSAFLLSDFTNSLSYYTLHSALWNHVTACILWIPHGQITQLAAVLGELKHLRVLDISIQSSQADTSVIDSQCISNSVVAAVRAAAKAQSLKSLDITAVDENTAVFTSDMLLPLTAAAGGPGSRLHTLRLAGNFECVAALNHDSATEAGLAATDQAAFHRTADLGDVVLVQQSCTERIVVKQAAAATSVELPASTAWHHPLRLLDGLTECLAILQQDSNKKLTLPIESLPASLEMFEASGLNIVGTAASSSTAAGNDLVSTTTCSLTSAHPEYTCLSGLFPELLQIYLTDCCLSSPGIFASRKLQLLRVCRSVWPGGWAAAAAAWPSVRDLTWEYDSAFDQSCSTSSVTGSPDAGSLRQQNTIVAAVDTNNDGQSALNIVSTTVDVVKASLNSSTQTTPSVGILPIVLAQFQHLRYLTLHGLPKLSVEILQLMEPLHLRRLLHINLDISKTVKRQLQAASSDTAAVLAKGDPDKTSDHISSGLKVRGSHGDPKVIKQWLQQQLPWATVA